MHTCFLCHAPASTFIYERPLHGPEKGHDGLYSCEAHVREATRLFSLTGRDKHLVCMRPVVNTFVFQEEPLAISRRFAPAVQLTASPH